MLYSEGKKKELRARQTAVIVSHISLDFNIRLSLKHLNDNFMSYVMKRTMTLTTMKLGVNFEINCKRVDTFKTSKSIPKNTKNLRKKQNLSISTPFASPKSKQNSLIPFIRFIFSI
jgi:hypothetical protein